MALLGKIIKSAIDISGKLKPRTESLEILQREQLLWLLNKAKDTAFGKYYGFTEIRNASDPVQAYREEVPIFHYEDIHQNWWIQQQKLPDITWPGQPKYFALSSGTTGSSSKRIPVTEAMLDSIRNVGVSLLRDLGSFDLPEEVFEKEVLMLSSSANLERSALEHLEGEISGINVHNFPGWYEVFYRPGKDIARIDDWDERVKAIVKAAPDWDVGAIAGIPSWVQLMLQAIVKEHSLTSIHEIWPDLTIYASGGVAFDPYEKGFKELCDKPLTIIDTYLASEGFLGYTARPGALNMKLALSHGIYYEFIPFDERGFDETGELLPNPEVRSIGEVKPGEEYALLVSTSAGAWRYMIGDTIRFNDLGYAEFEITGRTKFFLNVVGSQLSEEKINQAISNLSENTGANIEEFSVSAMQDDASGDFYHQWLLATDVQIDEMEARRTLDNTLQSINKNYRVARNKALKDVRVKTITRQEFYDMLAMEKKKGGQTKTPKVVKAEEMGKYLETIAKLSG